MWSPRYCPFSVCPETDTVLKTQKLFFFSVFSPLLPETCYNENVNYEPARQVLFHLSGWFCYFPRARLILENKYEKKKNLCWGRRRILDANKFALSLRLKLKQNLESSEVIYNDSLTDYREDVRYVIRGFFPGFLSLFQDAIGIMNKWRKRLKVWTVSSRLESLKLEG